MITVKLCKEKIFDHQADGFAIFLNENFKVDELVKKLKPIFPAIEDHIKKMNFKGSKGSLLKFNFSITNSSDTVKSQYGFLVGLGNTKDKFKLIENYRRAIGNLIRKSESLKLKSLIFELPEIDAEKKYLVEETTIVASMAAYNFQDFITSDDKKNDIELSIIVDDPEKYKSNIAHGVFIAKAVNEARHWCDMPSNKKSPAILADYAAFVAKDHGLTAKIFYKDDISEMGMGGIEAVGKGSANEPRLAILEYHSHASARTIALVGKGVTFDTGGYNLKPGSAMENMKDDMAGAAVVMSIMKIIAHLKPKINVVGLAPLVENMVSGNSTRPSDIIRFYNGKTAEVKDIDAEGRLILADALAYAVKNYKPAHIFDVATLTGACTVALGHFYSGLFSDDEELCRLLIESSQITGERVWRMPLDEDYKPALRSEVADLSNIGTQRYKAGSTTGALFLQNFVGDTPWAHLDIAGTAFGVPDISYYRSGATGFGVRLIVDMLMKLN